MPASAARELRIADFDNPGLSPASRGSRQMISFNVGIRGASLRSVGICGNDVATQVRVAWLMMYSVVSGPRVS